MPDEDGLQKRSMLTSAPPYSVPSRCYVSGMLVTLCCRLSCMSTLQIYAVQDGQPAHGRPLQETPLKEIMHHCAHVSHHSKVNRRGAQSSHTSCQSYT